MSAEWYYAPASYISVGYFRKNVKNFIGVGGIQVQVPGIYQPYSGARANQARAVLGQNAPIGQIRDYIFTNFPGSTVIQDADNDGQNNLDEYRSGTDPNDPNSRLGMISVSDVSGNGTNYELTWSSVSNPEVTYEISWSTDLRSWTSFETGIPAVGSTTVRQAAIVAQPPVFFRVGASR